MVSNTFCTCIMKSYEKLQIVDTSFKTHEQLQIFKQPDSRLFYEQHLLLTVEDIPKDTKEHSTIT